MKHAVAISVLAILASLVTACDETHIFQLTNATASRVYVEMSIEQEGDGDQQTLKPFSLGPGESNSDHGGIFFQGRRLHVTARSGGTIVLERTFTYDELKALDFRIEITESVQP